MFSVEMTLMPASKQLLDVLPALLVPRAGNVRMRELVDERHLRPPREHGVHVHLLEHAVAVGDLLPGHDLEVADLLGGLRAPVRLDEADDDVLAVLAATPAFVQHREGLADARGGTEVDTELPSRHGYSVPLTVVAVEREVELEDVDTRLAEEAERAVVRVLVDEREHIVDGEPSSAGDAGRLERCVLGRDVRVEAGAGSGERVDRSVRGVQIAIRLTPLLDSGEEILVRRPEIRRRARHGVVAVAGRGGTGMEVARGRRSLGR